MDDLKVVEHSKCRLCGNDSLDFIFSIGDQYINDFVTEDKINKGKTAPLDIVYCSKCDLSQLKHTAPQDLLYSRQYWYRSGVTDTMKRELRNIVEDVSSKMLLEEGDIVLDIGANDGTMLENFPKSTIWIGCEPANNLVEELATRCDRVIHDFWSEGSFLDSVSDLDYKKAKVVTAIGMFYDLDDPVSFVSDIQKVLDDDGIFVAQLMCSQSMFKMNDLGNICHEHLEYYSYDSLKYLFEKNGLKIFKISENNVNGGSYRVYCKKNLKKSVSYREKTSFKDIKQFVKNVIKNRTKTLKFIKDAKKENKTIMLYGASTKGNTLLQYYGITPDLIKYAVERSRHKWGKYTIGSGLEIISEEKSRKLNPDYFYVMPYGFIDEFVKREKKWLDKGGKFLLPYPNFKVVK